MHCCKTSRHPTNEGQEIHVKFNMANVWTSMFDGSSREFQSCVGVVLVSAERYESEHALRFTSKASNNQNEYETIIAYMKLARKLSSHRYLLSDFPLVVNQINAELEKKEEQLIKYLEMTKLGIMALEIVRVKRV